MKQILFFVALSLAVVSCKKNEANAVETAPATQTQKANQLDISTSVVEDALPTTTIKWDRLSHDFGNIKEGEIVTTTFTITNTGDNPLVINNAKGSCGCTVPKVDKNVPIAPGASTDIEVQFNSNGRPNLQTKSVELFGNFTPTPSKATIKAMVEAKPKVEAAQ